MAHSKPRLFGKASFFNLFFGMKKAALIRPLHIGNKVFL
ncbi:hypothetical protein CECT5772_06348 [Streptococcus equi subsp. ruminatorum CECT 5772]|uniref:Uncharacterized protein n=1 Tax=Streptococcus equi subsp. ruminatorum CECT 5772 TaxID=1051981 RepID=A0A922NTW7_9STRE|nr:hypothetical protein CECT5772_06348 [Streptococcus equi subsp. ruminatorum CECT 5772]